MSEMKTLSTNDAGYEIRMSDERCVVERPSADVTLAVGDLIDPTGQVDYGARHEITGFNPDDGTISYIDAHDGQERTEPHYMLTSAIRYTDVSKDAIRSR